MWWTADTVCQGVPSTAVTCQFALAVGLSDEALWSERCWTAEVQLHLQDCAALLIAALMLFWKEVGR
jgi:hypothetical protein